MSKYRITLDGKTYEMDVEFIDGTGTVQSAPRQTETKAAAPAAAPASPSTAPAKAAPSDQTGADASKGAVVAPMPGTVIKIFKKPGDEVKAREVVLILEAMKMENEIIAPADGTIAVMNCAVNGTVASGDVLFEVK